MYVDIVLQYMRKERKTSWINCEAFHSIGITVCPQDRGSDAPSSKPLLYLGMLHARNSCSWFLWDPVACEKHTLLCLLLVKVCRGSCCAVVTKKILCGLADWTCESLPRCAKHCNCTKRFLRMHLIISPALSIYPCPIFRNGDFFNSETTDQPWHADVMWVWGGDVWHKDDTQPRWSLLWHWDW